MSEAVFHKIKQELEDKDADYDVFRHKPVRTSKEAAEARSGSVEEGMKRGAKAMIVRSEGEFYQFVLPADLRLDFDRIRDILDTNSVSLADPEEVEKVIDCEPGAVPPFGSLFDIPTYVDPALLEREEIDFNAGMRTVSMTLDAEDWREIVQPEIANFSKGD